jgi:hypothetical protein
MEEVRKIIRKIIKENVLEDSNFNSWFNGSKIVDSNGSPFVVHHGTSEKFSKFNLKKATMGIIWFTSNKDSIESGDVGAQGKGYIMDLYVRMKNPAGWDEYDKYSLYELQSMGYDGAILPDPDGTITGFVFNPGQLKSVKNKGEWSKENDNIFKEDIFEAKKLVREVLYENSELIEERLMNVDDDVDMIYDYYFKDYIEKVKNTNSLKNVDFEQSEYSTSFLNSPLAKKADKLNPCKIFINIGSNHYDPKNSVIAVGVSEGAVNFVLDNFNGNLERAVQGLKLQGNKSQSINLSNEFSESKVKGSIHHELAHWIDDTLHNSHIKGRAVKASETGGGMTKRGLPINADTLEIQGQIHNVVQLKKEYSNIWDSLTFQDLLKLSTTLNVVNNQLNGDVKINWKRNLLTRMHREGLLGKNMIN